jgi:hypothetical protein
LTKCYISPGVSPSRKPSHFGVVPFPGHRRKGKRSGGARVGRRRRRGQAEHRRRCTGSRSRRTRRSAAAGEGGAGPGPRRRKPLPRRRVSPAPSRRRLHRRPTVSGAVLHPPPPPALAEPCCQCRLRRTPALYGRPSCHAPSRELVSLQAMSGLRAVFACRFPSPPPRRRPPCTPAREAKPLRAKIMPRVTPRHVAAPRTARTSCLAHLCSGLRAMMVLCRGVSHPSRGHAHLSAQGHDYSTPLLVRVDARRRRVSG